MTSCGSNGLVQLDYLIDTLKVSLQLLQSYSREAITDRAMFYLYRSRGKYIILNIVLERGMQAFNKKLLYFHDAQ